MRITLLTLVLALAGVPGSAHAAVIGEIERKTAGFGYVFGAGVMSVDDPDGATGDEFVVQPLALAYTRKLSGDLRYWLEPYYQAATFDASVDEIGQDLTRFGMRVSFQQYVVPAARFLPWIGAGLDIAHTQYTSRHTIDVDGYLANRFPDRSETGVNLLVNAQREWKLSGNRSVNARIEYLSPIGGDMSSLSVSLVYLFDI
ncbi:MAG: hypothetical protein FD165_2690 [Gammaproteobacteria bacterium]|nr:MAG: hypothetical protein FD165_2690 [Gammaproteobacteria bacterium]TND01759.1 MAG: hypothetical protein FD120_2523 [Gammaproteobacteria bacterium]